VGRTIQVEYVVDRSGVSLGVVFKATHRGGNHTEAAID